MTSNHKILLATKFASTLFVPRYTSYANKSLELEKESKYKTAVLTFDTWTEETQDAYRKGPLKDAQMRKYPPKRRNSRLELTSQDDAEEFGA
jgi:hypothetical protein